jgi:hypothetical protein
MCLICSGVAPFSMTTIIGLFLSKKKPRQNLVVRRGGEF